MSRTRPFALVAEPADLEVWPLGIDLERSDELACPRRLRRGQRRHQAASAAQRWQKQQQAKTGRAAHEGMATPQYIRWQAAGHGFTEAQPTGLRRTLVRITFSVYP